MLANLYARLGRNAEAHERVIQLVDHDDHKVFDRRSEYWLLNMALLGDACVSVGDEARARVIYERAADVTNVNVVVGTAGIDGSFDRVLGRLAGLLSRWEDAEKHFATGRAREQHLKSPALVARTDVHHAEMLLRANRSGDLVRADELLSAAVATANGLGMRNLQRDIDHIRDR